MLIFLAFAYLFVGVAHTIACLDQVVASDAFTISTMSDRGDAGEPSGTPSNCDHCPTCTPVVMPPLTISCEPAALTVQPIVTIAALRVADHSRLDTPPPKPLI